MYHSWENDLYWVCMANEANATVRGSRLRAQKLALGKKQRQLKLFFPDGSLKYVGIDKVRPLPETKQGNEVTVVMTGIYTKLTKALPSQRTNASAVTFIVSDDCLVSFRTI